MEDGRRALKRARTSNASDATGSRGRDRGRGRGRRGREDVPLALNPTQNPEEADSITVVQPPSEPVIPPYSENEHISVSIARYRAWKSMQTSPATGTTDFFLQS